MIINFDKKVKSLERQNKWNEVIDLLESQWKKDKSDLNKCLCIGAEIWFVLVFYERLDIKDVNNNHLVDKLMDITNYGFEHFLNESRFNAIFGYMIYLMPYHFKDFDGDYYGWVNKGRNMMKKAYLVEKSNPVYSALYYSSIGQDKKFNESCILFNQRKNEFFSQNDEVGGYFHRILSCSSYR